MVALSSRFIALAVALGAAPSFAARVATAPVAVEARGVDARAADPCAKIANQTFVPPADALACQKAFPFNETLRQNVLSAVARVFDFYTFEDYYLNSPPPFQESTTNIRADIARINSTHYDTDYDFNRAVWNFTTQLNDGHTRWFPSCYDTFQNLLPAPVVSLEVNGVQSVYIVPDLVGLVNLVGADFVNYFKSIGFNWQRLAFAKVLSIEGMNPYSYIDLIAHTISGNYLDHGVRVNSVLSSYRISDVDFSQRFGDLAGPPFPDQTGLTFTLIPTDTGKPETVTVPYLASFGGVPFTDKESYWANNCAATNTTNGQDNRQSGSSSRVSPNDQRLQPRAVIRDTKGPGSGVGLPSPFIPSLPQQPGSEAVIKSYILPGNKTGVMFVGSFEPDDFNGFQTDVQSAVNSFKKAGVTQLLVDLTNNGGGFVCLGEFLHQFLAGAKIGYPGFQTSNRANTLAQKIVKSDIAQNISGLTFYEPDNWAFLNDTPQPNNFDYNDPASVIVVNGQKDANSQRFHDICTPFAVDIPENPPFDLSKVAIVGNGNCASTCSLFSTLMVERHNVKTAVFGGKPGEQVEYKGMAGNQVLEFADLKTEIKTAGLNDDPLAPPDLLIDGDMRVNWRTAWSFLNEGLPIAYVSEPAKFRFPYTNATYNNPQNLWVFAANALF